jgi:TPP-dependent pyruvate/acetoin dehydrogenase alpha subunit
VAAYGIPAVQVDGMDVFAVRSASHAAVAHARAGHGPVLVEAMTYRYGGQYEGDTQSYKPPAEVEYWRARDPLMVFRQSVKTTHRLRVSEDVLDKIMAEAKVDVQRAFAEARDSPWPELELGLADVYADWEEDPGWRAS